MRHLAMAMALASMAGGLAIPPENRQDKPQIAGSRGSGTWPQRYQPARPSTDDDHEALAKAEEKRRRKAAKRLGVKS